MLMSLVHCIVLSRYVRHGMYSRGAKLSGSGGWPGFKKDDVCILVFNVSLKPVMYIITIYM
jgi:hypothetical protein